MRKSKIVWILFNIVILIIAVCLNIKKGPFDAFFIDGHPEKSSVFLYLFFYIYVWFNIGFFMSAYVFLFQKHTAIFLTGTITSIVLANIAYLTIFNSSRELTAITMELYPIIIWPDLLLLLTKRIKFIFLSPVISIVIIFLIPDGQGAYWIAGYLSRFADVFLWTPIIWVIGALTILTQRQESVGNGNDMSPANETAK